MARREIHDTSVLIRVINDEAAEAVYRKSLSSRRAGFSSVVVAELRAGTRSKEDAEIIDRVVGLVKKANRLLTPNHEDWDRAGQLIARQIRLTGAMAPRDHLADVLILVSAARIGATVVTYNFGHFEMWASIAKASGLDARVEAPPV